MLCGTEDVVKFEKSKGMSSTTRASRGKAQAKENTAPDAITDEDRDSEAEQSEAGPKTSKVSGIAHFQCF